MTTGSLDAIVVAAGESRRMGGGISKILRPLGNRPLIAHTLRPLQSSDRVRQIAIVCREQDRDEIQQIVEQYDLHKATGYMPPGGSARADSVCAGMSFLKQSSPPDWVLVQDGARPFLRSTLIDQCFQACQQTGAAVVAMPMKDTVKEADQDGLLVKTLNRDRLWRIQTPQIFRFDLLWKAYQELPDGDRSKWTDDAMVVESHGVKSAVVSCDETNLKITTPEDFELAEYLLARRPDLLET